jgi:LuxR family maltose regulon positive regulatory protein
MLAPCDHEHLDRVGDPKLPMSCRLHASTHRDDDRTLGGVVLSLPVRPTARLELRLLGPVELRRDGALVATPEWRRERVRSLLSYLVLHGPVSRTRISEELWPEFGPDSQSRNLRVTLTYLLRVLEPDRSRREPSFFVRQHGGNLILHPDEWLDVDVWRFDRECRDAANADRDGSPAVALDHALRAADLWRAEPTELSEQWAAPLVERRRRRFTDVVIRAGEILLAQHDAGRAVAIAERALEGDPWEDRAHRLAVAAHRANHDEFAVRRALGRYHEAVTALGLSPGEATRLTERLLEGA